MSWIPLATRLGLHIALGYLVSLLVLGPAPVGKFFYQLTGWTAAVVAVLAAVFAGLDALQLFERGAGTWGTVRVVATLLVLLPAALYVSNKPPRRRLGLLLGVTGGLVALIAHAFGPDGGGARQVIADFSAAAVAGGACFAMVFGHGYLTIPKLPVEHLERINRFLGRALVLRLLLSSGLLLFAWGDLHTTDDWGRERIDLWTWLDLGVRFLVGLVAPILFTLMVASSLRYRNTQSATGILYATTVLVWIGEAVALHVGLQSGVVL